jgi:transcriptional regulator with XRE-family HTH domain
MKKKKLVTLRIAGPVDKYIGARMRERRLALGVSQADLAEKVGITFQQIQKYEKGTNRISAARLFEICNALGVPLASMFERDVHVF